jgi:glycine/D-amino acid oxidase-like deaminating enzyme
MSTNTFAPGKTTTTSEKHVPSLPLRSTVVVIGAGSFGGWAALYLLRKGYSVILVDCWGPGNSRSSSGDETRVIRSTYGANELYFDLNVRALELWKEHQTHWKYPVFYNTGVLWMCHHQDAPIVDDSIPFSRKHNMEYQYISKQELMKQYPLINSQDIHHGWLDPFGGYLKARESCQLVAETFKKEGGTYLTNYVSTPSISSQKIKSLKLSDGTELKADVFLFACGSWLPQLFPDVLGQQINCTRQEVFYFGTPAEKAHQFDQLPVWIDVDGQDYYYGIPGNANRGFKIGVDRRGIPFDPTSDNRIGSPEVLQHARAFMEHRFPSLKNAPLVESRVCPYENSNSGNFIFDQHPEAENCWFLGGGSGHGFKHGPALGEWVASSFQSGKAIPSLWRLSFKN